MQILSGTTLPNLSKKIASNLCLNMLDRVIDNFADGEIKIEILDKISSEILIVQSTTSNDKLMELLLLINTVKRANAIKIYLLIPYFGYSRQNRQSTGKQEPVAVELITNLLAKAGATEIITLDFHSSNSTTLSPIFISNLCINKFFTIKYKLDDVELIVAPDFGSIGRANELAKLWGIKTVYINKIRIDKNKSKILKVNGNVSGKNCLIIDDILDTCGTLCNAVSILKENGAKKIYCFITHGIFSNGAEEKLKTLPIEKIFISNSIENNKLPNKVELIAIDKAICDFIKNRLI